MNLITWSARGAAALVAGVAGAASWEHIASVAYAAGEQPWVAFTLPAAIDGLIVVGVTAVVEDRRAGRRPRLSAKVAVLLGVVATLAANVASAAPTTTARLVAIVAPIAFLVSFEVLTRSGRAAPAEAAPEPAPPATPRPGRRPAGKRTAAERVAAARQRHPDGSQGQIARAASVSVRTVARHDAGRQVTEPNHRGHDQAPELTDATA